MAGIIQKKCMGCGEQHSLLWEEADIPEAGKSLEFNCPKTRRNVKFESPAVDWWKIMQYHPPGAVILRKAE